MDLLMSAAFAQGEAPLAARSPRLLIVDDVAENRAILARRFQRQAYHITEAEDGFCALELIASQSFDLVLPDVMMQAWTGSRF